ncbi:hypothetical protein GKE82_15855 [Conexibacter sp. W3-3-2]|uniref:Inositol-phosphate phosphatase n=1 Tax=Paraconexibacter algicola TaxID=2133960 RepID=A0A2T4UND2_9ACTN|nr:MULTISPECIES: inositol monophosphatase family protein [Solirubrobacterales]MTD45722.1 hypothetical protein [Conexibacter sp. W3-3-2]PTL60739.1 hypothetical protein C7Y72_06850 [Paraconexibacter algicola]
MPAPTSPVLEHDWLGACRRAREGLQAVLVEHPTSRERVLETGERGEGGDRTLVIDAAAEDCVFAELERLHEAGARFTAVSEERGTVDFGAGGGPPFVVVDPIDGSMNAKRGMAHHSISIAVADGPTMGDVVFGYVYDLGPREEWHAVRGEGAYLDGVRIDAAPPERLTEDGRLELVAVESAHPWWLRQSSDALLEHVHRIRAMGSIAISMCQVALTRVDGMATLWRSRAMDAAAAQLIVRESGGLVAFPGFDDPLGAPVADLTPIAPVIAARSAASLRRLAALPATDGD